MESGEGEGEGGARARASPLPMPMDEPSLNLVDPSIVYPLVVQWGSRLMARGEGPGEWGYGKRRGSGSRTKATAECAVAVRKLC